MICFFNTLIEHNFLKISTYTMLYLKYQINLHSEIIVVISFESFFWQCENYSIPFCSGKKGNKGLLANFLED